MARKRAKALWQDSHPGAVWTQQLSISMSQWKTTVENETEEEKRERGAERGTRYRVCILSGEQRRSKAQWRSGQTNTDPAFQKLKSLGGKKMQSCHTIYHKHSFPSCLWKPAGRHGERYQKYQLCSYRTISSCEIGSFT